MRDHHQHQKDVEVEVVVGGNVIGGGDDGTNANDDNNNNDNGENENDRVEPEEDPQVASPRSSMPSLCESSSDEHFPRRDDDDSDESDEPPVDPQELMRMMQEMRQRARAAQPTARAPPNTRPMSQEVPVTNFTTVMRLANALHTGDAELHTVTGGYRIEAIYRALN